MFAQLREREPLIRVRLPYGEPAWLATRYEDVKVVLGDPRFSRAAAVGRDEPSVRPQPTPPDAILNLDPPEHSRLRRLVAKAFTTRRVEQLRPRAQEIADDLVAAMLANGSPADMVANFALPLPVTVICELLGVPYADHDYFQSHTTGLIRRTTSAEDRYRIVDEMRHYLAGLITDKLADPPDDLIGRQIRRQLDEDGDTDLESLTSLSFLLLLAGHETTANMISLGVLALLTHPDQFAELRADPARTPLAVEELLRYFTIAEVVTSRIAEEDVELGGVLIRAGEGVVGDALSANRDDRAFADAEKLDLARGSRNHVAFGFGPHQCLGQNLARKELQIVFDTLSRRVPTLALAAEPEDLPYKDDATIYGVYQLPVTW